jgi:hypothetical protein
MEYLETKETTNENMVTHTWKAPDGTLHGICVDKSVTIEEAYTLMINYVEEEPEPIVGLS